MCQYQNTEKIVIKFFLKLQRLNMVNRNASFNVHVCAYICV